QYLDPRRLARLQPQPGARQLGLQRREPRVVRGEHARLAEGRQIGGGHLLGQRLLGDAEGRAGAAELSTRGAHAGAGGTAIVERVAHRELALEERPVELREQSRAEAVDGRDHHRFLEPRGRARGAAARSVAGPRLAESLLRLPLPSPRGRHAGKARQGPLDRGRQGQRLLGLHGRGHQRDQEQNPARSLHSASSFHAVMRRTRAALLSIPLYLSPRLRVVLAGGGIVGHFEPVVRDILAAMSWRSASARPTGLTVRHIGSAVQRIGLVARHNGLAVPCTGSAVPYNAPAAQCAGSPVPYNEPAVAYSGLAAQYIGPPARYDGPTAPCTGPAVSYNGSGGSRREGNGEPDRHLAWCPPPSPDHEWPGGSASGADSTT